MAKASKTFVDWLLPGERGWEAQTGCRWKWDSRSEKMWTTGGARTRWYRTGSTPDDLCHFTEVFPRPAPRRTVRKVRAWAIVRPDGTVPEVWSDRETALMRQDVGQIVVKLTGEYTPKARKK